ncbi:MAG: putative glycoside hydrolase [Bacillota bacterium]
MTTRRLITAICLFTLCFTILCGGIGDREPIRDRDPVRGDKHPETAKNGFEKLLLPSIQIEASAANGAYENLFPNSGFSPEPVRDPLQNPPVVRGIYATGWSAGSSKKMPQIFNILDTTYLNAVVIDVKDDEGTVSYESKVPMAVEIASSRKKIPNIDALMAKLKEKEIYPIARIVVFKDPYLAVKKPELAVKSRKGGLWRDKSGLAWVDPHSKTVWQYVVDVAKEAASKGFKEIQFDYVRFLSDGDLSDCIYPHANARKRHEVIRDYLHFAYAQLKPYGVVVSADIFGLVLSVPDDLGIGQQLEDIAQEVDLICPMVYPSHYYRGTFGIQNPNAKPYTVILRSLSDAQARILGMKAKIRPWLQDFTLGTPPYGREQLAEQIRAVREAGIGEWLWWNPSNQYSYEKHNFTGAEIFFPAEQRQNGQSPPVQPGEPQPQSQEAEPQ